MEKENRTLVIPGETIVSGNSYLPGDGTYRDGEDVVAAKFGIPETNDKQVRIIPVSGAYFPRRGNTVIGTVVDVTFNGWLIDFGGSSNAFLSLNEVHRYVNRNELNDFLDIGDSAVVKVWDVKAKGVDVSMKMRGFGKVEGGMLFNVNPNKVPRVIGREGSMVKMIKAATGVNITVGQNGVVWVKADDIEKELNAKKIVEFVVANATMSGLTEKTEDFIKELGLEVKSDNDAEPIEENREAEAEENDKETKDDGDKE
jgi:exosome complex component RRP4